MGIVDKLKHRLPIIGGQSAPAPAAPPAWVKDAGSPTPAATRDVQAEIDSIVKTNPLVLFMKGTPDSPMCGFSANAVSILSGHGVAIKGVDVLRDADIRQGIKEYSKWPTLPQCYIGGEFVGGSDILTELHQSGELVEMIAKVKSA